jgi:hypothetical protein
VVETIDARATVSHGANLEEALRKIGISSDPGEEGRSREGAVRGEVGHILAVAVRVGDGGLGGIELGIVACIGGWEEAYRTWEHWVNLGHRR